MVVDQDARRRRIAEIAIDLIAREGLGAATIRAIAAEGGFSTAAITHYFADKAELLHATFAMLSAIGEEEFVATLDGKVQNLSQALMTMVAWCPGNVRRWKAYLAFWDQAARDPDLARNLAGSTATGLALIEKALALRSETQIDLERAARLVNSLVQGISMQAIVAPADWSRARVERTLADAVELALRLASPSDALQAAEVNMDKN